MNKNQLIQYLKANDLWLKRSMGQNFLLDESVLKKIVAAAELKPSDTVVEIGPGLGILTWELVKRAGRVLALEKDNLFAKLLIQNAKIKNQNDNSKLKIINQNVLEFDLKELENYKIVANIPYNITSAVIRKFLAAENKPSEMVLMIQKEVAERIVAKPGEMSLLSVAVQFYADAEIVAIVPASSFFPKPKVDSAIIKLKTKVKKKSFISRNQISRRSFLLSASGERESARNRRNLVAADSFSEEEFFRLVKFGFAARRKTLENNLAAGFQITKTRASDIIKKAGLSENIRAQELGVDGWLKIYQKTYGTRKKISGKS